MASYYDELSNDSSSSDDDDAEDVAERIHHFAPTPGGTITDADDDGDTARRRAPRRHDADDDGERLIVHVDVDCFYCQCEHLDRGIPRDRPIAIGQKHIVVTSNYAARACGVQKLQLRTDAVQACPNLLILEGSDLEHYRRHARSIYHAFRAACHNIAGRQGRACKGAMDEMTADLTDCVGTKETNVSPTGISDQIISPVFIYGDTSDYTRFTEDQSGVSVLVQNQGSSDNVNGGVTAAVSSRLLYVAALCLRMRQHILDTTGFTTTFGVSVNPLLAKLVSGMRKPGTVNVLRPERAPRLLRQLPLRKIPGVGRAMAKALALGCARHFQSNNAKNNKIWTCGDLLSVPLPLVQASLAALPTNFANEAMARTVLGWCRGRDATIIHDDQGGAAKTVSVENSFRRGTVVTSDIVRQNVLDLYHRLPRLLRERQRWSRRPDRAFPSTIRLVVRFVDHTKGQRQHMMQQHSTTTLSKQAPFDGRCVVQGDEPAACERALQAAVEPLLAALVYGRPSFDITRINIAVSGFGDNDTAHAITNVTASIKDALRADPQSKHKSDLSGTTNCKTARPNNSVAPTKEKIASHGPPKKRRIDQYFISRQAL